MDSSDPYIPINCGFHDELLAAATLRKECEILWRDVDGRTCTTRARIEDVYTKDKEEFLRLSGGEVIRLDRIIRIDAKSPPMSAVD